MSGSVSRSVALRLLYLLLLCVANGADYRLDGSVVPSYYNLIIGVLRDSAEPTLFDGEVSITMRVVSPLAVPQIILHADTLNISECWLLEETGAQMEVIDISRLVYEAATQQVTVPLTQALQSGKNYTLGFKYTGHIRTDMAGLFSASYVEQDTNVTKWLAVTQMQRINARLVLPCFDEPAMKAKFQLQVVRPNGYQSIANTKLKETTPASQDRFVDHFEETPVMSTYLLAFMVANYSARGNVSELAVLTRPEFYNNTEFSYHVGQQVVSAYDELFKLPYAELGNEVLQYASSPRFPHNGMENWGLIIYSDAVLVQEAGYSDDWSDKEFAIRIIAHETSHMWFGDSVTFSWWSYFWLNEAFARYYEYFMAHQLYPEYHLDEQFVVRQMQLIFGTDSRNSTQPMTSPETEIQTPSEIAYKFSGIAYAKGACIVRMWRNLMGPENFDRALRNYLKQYHLTNTVPSNLFDHLKENWPSNQEVNLTQFFEDYTEQVGYPLLIVRHWAGKYPLVTVEQERFLLNIHDGSNRHLKYTVPITYASSLSPNFYNLTPSEYLNKTDDKVQILFDDQIDWILLNLRQSNYQRVYYDRKLRNGLLSALSASNHSGIPVENRAQLIDDMFSLAEISYVDYYEVFQFLEYMSKEVDYVAWYAVYENMNLVAKRLTPEQLPHFRRYLSDITKSVFEKLGVDWSSQDTPLDVANRKKLVQWLCRYQASKCRNKVNVQFVTSSEQPSPDYRETFYCAASSSDFNSYTLVWGKYFFETRPSERQLLWLAASCTSDYETHYYKMIIDGPETVELKKKAIARMYEENPELVQPIFEMVTANITILALDLNSWSETAEVISDMAEYFTTREQQQLFEEFYRNNHQLFGESAAAVLSKSLESVDENISWADSHLFALGNYLINRNGSSGFHGGTFMVVVLLALASLLAWL
ncbi:aminopeptidase N [Drosophila eugracilis]|uniref:aminopeptidase N n=1 Tax=Drosophila eugracilis TaxID=29029 RepID=UPI001BDAE206|nr:aminopeptidase N [Drosophila eugracilis]